MVCKRCKMAIHDKAKVCPYCQLKQKQNANALSVLLCLPIGLGAFLVTILIINANINKFTGSPTSSTVAQTAKTTESVQTPQTTTAQQESISSAVEQAPTTPSHETTASNAETSTTYQKYNGFIIGDKQGTNHGDYCEVIGVVKNVSGHNCSYVAVTIGFYNANGTKITTGLDNILNLNNNEQWQYTVLGFGSNIETFKIENIEWF